MSRIVYLNGKFLAQRTTGVQRFARGIINALDRSLRSRPCATQFEVLLPAIATPMEGLEVIRQRYVGRPNRSLTLWEQWDLPRSARNGTLVCLSGSAPFLARKCVPTIHDAAVYKHPEAYSRIFVTWYRQLFAHLAQTSPFVLTVSESSARDLSLFLPKAEFRVVPNSAEHISCSPSDSSILNQLRLSPRGFLLAVGSLNPTKNFASLIEAYVASTLATTLPLVIVGSVNSDVFRKSGSSIDHPNVLWAGPVTDPQLRALYEHAAVFVFPSVYEGFGIPPLEAMTCGCPVAASNASSIPEVCSDAALYFDPLNPVEMLSTVNAILQNDECRTRLVERGLQRAKAFNWEKSASDFRSTLAEFGLIE